MSDLDKDVSLPTTPNTVPDAVEMPAVSKSRNFTFSIVIIMRNETYRMKRCVGNPLVSEFIRRSGEVLVFDTGSTDETEKMAKEFGCKVFLAGEKYLTVLTDKVAWKMNDLYCRKNEKDIATGGDKIFRFADARNAAGMAAFNEYVLQIDTGDELIRFDFDKIQDILDSPDPPDLFHYQHRIGSGPDELQSIARFYDRRVHRWEGNVHEVIYTPGKKRFTLDPEILQPSYLRDNNRNRYYFGGMALDLMDKPTSGRWAHYLGREMWYGKRYYSAIALLEGKYDSWPEEQSESLCIAGQCWEALGEEKRVLKNIAEEPAVNEKVRTACYEKAMQDYLKGLTFCPTRREPWLRISNLFRKLDNTGASAGYAEAALTIPRTGLLSETSGNYTHWPHDHLCWAYSYMGRMVEAKRHWKMCRKYLPEDTRHIENAKFFADLPDE